MEQKNKKSGVRRLSVLAEDRDSKSVVRPSRNGRGPKRRPDSARHQNHLRLICASAGVVLIIKTFNKSKTACRITRLARRKGTRIPAISLPHRVGVGRV
jgi:hypothetical protein